MIVLCDVSVIKISNSKIQNDGKNKTEIKNCKIGPEIRCLCVILNLGLNT